MRIAMLLDREMFEMYSDWKDVEWELVFFNDGGFDPKSLIATGAQVLVVSPGARITADIIKSMPELKLIQSQGVGYNAIDIDAAHEAGIYVCNCASVNARSVAEQTVLLILALLKDFRWCEDMIYAGKQMQANMSCVKKGLPIFSELIVGIVGLGAIGKELAALLKPFNCEIWYNDSLGDMNIDGLHYKPLNELYSGCDVISLHVPVTPETKNMINRDSLCLFKRGTILINTARGELMDHVAVVDALVSGRLGGLGADTLAPEPLRPDNPVLRDLPEDMRRYVALSPHIGGLTASCLKLANERVKQNIMLVSQKQRPKSIINGL